MTNSLIGLCWLYGRSASPPPMIASYTGGRSSKFLWHLPVCCKSAESENIISMPKPGDLESRFWTMRPGNMQIQHC